MTLPLILLIAILVIYPAFYSLHLATLNKSMSRFIGLGNFEFLFKRDTFWLAARHVAGALGHSGVMSRTMTKYQSTRRRVL